MNNFAGLSPALSTRHQHFIKRLCAAGDTLWLRAAATAAPAATDAAPNPNASNTGAAKGVSDVVPPIARMVIRNATLTLVVRDTQTQFNTVMRMADELKGYVASSSTNKDGADVQAQMVVRVPADRMDEALERVRKLAVQVSEEKVSGDDVSAEYMDLNSQVKNLEAAEQQLRDILARATQTDDVLKVFEQVKNVRGQIEQAKGRMQYLSQSAAMATITLTMLPDKPVLPVVAPGWRPEGPAKAALERLIGSLQSLADVVIWTAIYVLPMVAIVLVPLFIVAGLLRLRRVGRKSEATATL